MTQACGELKPDQMLYLWEMNCRCRRMANTLVKGVPSYKVYLLSSEEKLDNVCFPKCTVSSRN